jgi:hypothetical protein
VDSVLKDARFSELYKKNMSASFEQTFVVKDLKNSVTMTTVVLSTLRYSFFCDTPY